MPRSLRKGPFIDQHLMKKVLEAVASNNKRPDQDLVTAFHGRARDGRSDDCDS